MIGHGMVQYFLKANTWYEITSGKWCLPLRTFITQQRTQKEMSFVGSVNYQVIWLAFTSLLFKSLPLLPVKICQCKVIVCIQSMNITVTTLWADSADDNLMIYFLLLYFPEKLETICVKFQSLFPGKILKQNVTKCRLLKVLPSLLSLKQSRIG